MVIAGARVDWGGCVRQIAKKGEGFVETDAPLLVELPSPAVTDSGEFRTKNHVVLK